MLLWDSVLMLLVRLILFGLASLVPTAQSVDCGAEDSCLSLGDYCCIGIEVLKRKCSLLVSSRLVDLLSADVLVLARTSTDKGWAVFVDDVG
ncbi:hypothetical protein Nepgr_005232 [Nepenthes gracilis]|uniref:Uncharacterized protein n=1 Tax=Nepenthes gracilis TaxID=150966 RepID=A0AAD3S2T3_NEPGR|nr:hypothetical protein Nepgr_005232 [Nepenthes gracilis]